MMRQEQRSTSAVTVACRGLTSVFAVVGLLVLILNDHWLKQSLPGVVTGKLSDLGGLAFFPFLLGVAIGLVVRDPRCAARVAFGLTGAVFALVKLLPAGAEAASAFLSTVGVPSSIVADPTDLVALVVLLPGWRLWRRLEVSHGPRHSSTLPAYAIVPLALVATVATSCLQPDVVRQLVVSDGVLRADLGSGTARSEDGGRTWTREEYDPDDRLPAYTGHDARVVCEPVSSTCYRVRGEPMVEVSHDGGATWAIAWQIPPDRREFVRRSEQRNAGCSGGGASVAADGELVEVGGDHVFVAALQSEGVVVGTAGGEWRQVAVGDAAPEPLTGTMAFIEPEAAATGLVVLLGLLVGLGVSERRRREHMPWVAETNLRLGVGLGITVGVAAVVGVFFTVAGLLGGGLAIAGQGPFGFTAAVVVAILAVGAVATARLIRTRAKMADPAAPYRALAAAALAWAASFAPFAGWSAGLVTYRAAFALCVVLIAVTLPVVIRSAMDRSFERDDPLDDLFEPG